jgi:N-acetylglucosamine repressor
VGRHLGKTIAIAINLFNPQKVVIAGEIVEAEKVLLPAIEGCINAQALKAFRKNLPVVRSTLDHRSAIGAFALVKARHAQRDTAPAFAGKLKPLYSFAFLQRCRTVHDHSKRNL